MIHSFDVDHAQKYGLEAAILIYNIDFWIRKNKANQKHFYDGKYWTYNSVVAWSELFPYLTKDVIRKRLEYLVEQGVLIRGNFSADKRDRTSWYTIDFGKMHLAVEPNAIVSGAKSSLYTDSKQTDISATNVANELFDNSVVEKKKGNKPVKKPVDECYQDFVRVWCEAYPVLGFDGKVAGQKIKELISDTKDILIKRGKVPTKQATIDTFQYVINHVKNTGHFANGKPITTFRQQYRSIFDEIINGTGKKATNGSAGKDILKHIYGITTTR